MKAGLNQIEAEIVGNDFIVRQSGVLKEHPTLRDIVLRVAFLNESGSIIEIE
jgi:hypothetical protein